MFCLFVWLFARACTCNRDTIPHYGVWILCETHLQQFQSRSQGIGAEGCTVEVCCFHNSKGVCEMHVVHKGFG